jgi:hypothetical protein
MTVGVYRHKKKYALFPTKIYISGTIQVYAWMCYYYEMQKAFGHNWDKPIGPRWLHRRLSERWE